jgi:hypothetical protein
MNATQQLFEQYAYTLDAVADEPDCDDPASRRRLMRACAHGMREAATGHTRYEALRLCNAQQFSELCARNVAGERFDDMVDALMAQTPNVQIEGQAAVGLSRSNAGLDTGKDK